MNLKYDIMFIIKKQQSQQNPKILGSLRLNYIILFYLLLILFTPLYTYHMAVKQKQQPPFPHTTVTNTACHYPQATIFRWGMTSAAGFLTLIFHVIFRWYQVQAKKFQYPGPSYSYMYWPTMLSVAGYIAAIATIDTAGTGITHEVGAIYFFMCLYFLMINLTIVARSMRRWDTKFMSKSSLALKIIVANYFNCVWIYCFVGLALGQSQQNDDNKYFVIMQWNLVYAGLVWILCFLKDFKDVDLVLRSKKCNQTMKGEL